MTDRLICSVAVSLLGGILYGRYRAWYLPIGILLLVAGIAVKMAGRYGKKAAISIALRTLLCFLVFGAAYEHTMRLEGRNRQLEQLLSQEGSITVQGEIYKIEKKKEQFIYYLKHTQIAAEETYHHCGNIQVCTSTDSYQMGNQIQVTGWQEAFHLPRNEGNFNEKQYYESKNIKFRLNSGEEVLLSEKVNSYGAFLGEVRERMEQILTEYLPEKEAGVMIRMVLGNKNGTDQEIKDLYRQAGISHILAISGLHISMVGMGCYRILRKLGIPSFCCGICCLFLVAGFGIMTGMEISTFRAVVMFFLMMLGRLLGKTYDSITALSVSAAVQVWENPLVLEYAGFLLSYGAVLGVILTTGISENRKEEREGKKEKQKKWRKELVGTLKTSLSIQTATLPITLFFYYETPVYGVLANACILPFMGILLFSGIAGGVLGMLCPLAASWFFVPVKWILAGNEAVCRMLMKLPETMAITGQPRIEKILWYYLAALLVLYFFWKKRQKRYLTIIVFMTFILCGGNTPKGLEVDFLDVGQGDGIYWKNKKGEHFFLDGGSSDVKKAGTYRILPFLKYKGAKKIRAWFVSHADADHISGLKEVLESGYPVEYLVLAEGIVKDDAWSKLVRLAEQNHTGICYLKAGEAIVSEEVRLTAVYPTAESGTDRNASSMVLLFQAEEISGLLTGDIGTEQEQELLASGSLKTFAENGITFYKAAHHGSDFSNSRQIADETKPRYSMISCGEKNKYGHPGGKAVSHMEETGSKIFYTMKKGQIKLWWDGKKVQISQFQN